MADNRRSLGIGGGTGAVQRQYNRDAASRSSRYDVYERLGIARPSSGQSDVTRNFVDRYNEIADRSERESERDERGDGRRRATMLDRLAYASNQFAENIQGLSGQEEAAKTETPLDDIAAFGVGLFTGTLSAPFQGFAQIEEAVTGRRSTEMEDGYIPDEDLDLGQRLATGASGAINVVGPMLGGSGEMLRTMGRGAQAAMGTGQRLMGFGDDAIRAAGKSAQRSVSRMLGSGDDFASRALHVGVEIGKDALEEGAEEFVQSPLDEIRDGTFDDGWLERAVYAGGMGALGGGIMSGGSLAVNSALQHLHKDGGSGNDTKNPVNPDTETTLRRYGLNDSPTDMVKDAQDVAREQLRADQSTPGAASALQVSTGKVHGLDDGDVGAGIFRAIFYNPDGGRSAKMVADFFNMTTQDMAVMFSRSDYAAELAKIHRQNKANGTAKALILGRNPDTQNGIYTIDIDEIVDGDYIDLSPATFNFVKSDVDGDKITLFLDPAIKSQGYVSERLVDPVKATWNNEEQRYEPASNVEHSDFSFIPKSMSGKDARAIFERVFTNVFGQNAPVQWTTYADRWLKGDSTTNNRAVRNGSNSDVSMFLDTMRREIDAANSGVEGHRVVSELYKELASDPKNEFLRALDKEISDARTEIDTLAQTVLMPTVDMDENDPGYSSRGAIPDGMTKVIQAFDRMNLVMAKYSEGKSNSLFRQDGMLAMRAQAKRIRKLNQNLLSIAGRYSGNHSVLENMFAIAMRQSEIGGKVETNVSGVFDIALKSRMDRGFFSSHPNGVSTGADLKSMLDMFVDESNALANDFNEVIRQGEKNGDIPPKSITPKKQLKNDNESQIEVVRRFIEVFGDRAISSVLDTSNAPALENLTFNDWIESYIHDGRTSRTQFGGYDSKIQGFIDKAVASYYARLAGASQSMQAHLGMLSKAIRDLYKDGTPSGGNVAEAEYLVTALRKVFDPKIANVIGLVSIDSIDDGRWGRAIKSGNQSDICNFILSAGFAGKYDKVYDYFFRAKNAAEKKNMPAAKAWHALLLQELQKTALMSGTDKIITREIYGNVKELDSMLEADVLSRTYNAIVSMDMTFDEKYAAFSAEDTTDGCDLLIDALSTERVGPGQTDMNSRIEKSYSQYSMAIKASYARNQAIWSSTYQYLKKSGNEKVAAEAIVDLLGDCYYETSGDIMTGAIYATTTLSNAMKEKGMTPSAAQQLMQQSEISINGMLQSFQDKVFGTEFGIVSEEDFQSNPMMIMKLLVDPSRSIRVTSPRLGGEVVFNRQKVLDEAVGPNNNGELTLDNLNAIFTRWPQLITLIPQQKMVPGVSNESGSVTVQQRMSYPVFASIQSRIGEMSETTTSRGRKYIGGSRFVENKMRRAVSIQLMNDVDFAGFIIHRMGDVSSDLSMQSIGKKSARVVDQVVDAVLKLAVTPKGSIGLSRKMFKIYKSQWVALSESITDVYNSAYVLAEYALSGGKISHTLQSIIEERATLAILTNRIKEDIRSIAGDDAAAEFMGEIPKDTKASGALGSMAKEAANAYSDSVRQMLDFMALMHQAFPSPLRKIDIDDLDIDIAGIRESIENCKLLTPEQKRQILDSISSEMLDPIGLAIRQRSSMSDRIVVLDDFNVDPGDPGAVRQKIIDTYQKLHRLDHEYNSDRNKGKLMKRVRDDILGILSGDSRRVQKAQADIDNLMQFYNSIYIKQHVEHIKFDTGAAFNPNILNAYVNDQNALERFINDARSSLIEEFGENVVNQPDVDIAPESISIPRADFSDPILDVMSNRAAVNSTRGPAALRVALNGAEGNVNSPLAFLPRDEHTDIEPTEMSYADIIDALEEDNGQVAKGRDRGDLRNYPFNRFINAKMMVGTFTPASQPGKRGYSTRPITIETLESLRKDPNKKIWVFDPIDSPNGLDQEHTYELFTDTGSDSLSILMELARLTDGAQEGLALKLSKTVGDIKKIVNAVRNNGVSDGTPAVAYSGNFKEDLKKAVRSFRCRYRKQLMVVFNDEANKVLGIGPNNAVDFANFLTPYVEVTTDKGIFLIDTARIMAADPTAFNDRIAEITKDGAKIISAKPVSVTPDMIASRIARAEADLVTTDKKTPSRKRAEDAARKSLVEWDRSYTVNRISAGDILDGVRPMSADGLPFEIAEDNQSIMNLFIDKISGEGTGRVHPQQRRNVAYGWQRNESEMRRIEDVNNRDEGKMYRLSSSGELEQIYDDVKVVKSFGAKNVLDDQTDKMYKYATTFQSLDDVSDASNNGDRSTVGIVLDKDSVWDALKWSIAYDQDLLVPKEFLNDASFQMFDDMDLVKSGIRIGRNKDVSFVRIAPYRNSIYASAVSRMFESKVTPLDRDEIVETVFSYTKYLADSAGNANRNTTGDLGFDISKPIEAHLPSLFQDVSVRGATYRLITPAEMDSLYKDLNNNKIAFSDIFETRNIQYSLGVGALRDNVMDFLKWGSQNKAEHRNSYGRGDCVAVVAVDTDQGVRYAPIVADTNSPKKTVNAQISITPDNTLVVTGDAYATISDIYNDEVSKIAVGAVSYKGIIIPVDEKGMPLLAVAFDGKPKRADFVMNYDTFSGRVEDMDLNLQLNNLWYSYLKYGGSIFYEYRDGKWELRDIFKNMPDGVVIGLMNGEKDAWDLVLKDNKYRLSEDEAMNSLLKKVARNAHMSYMPKNFLLSSISRIGKDGTARLRGSDMDYQLALSGMTRDEMLKLFHYLNPNLCPNGIDDKSHVPGTTLMDAYGRVYIQVEITEGTRKGQIGVVPMDWSIAPGNSLQHSTLQDRVSSDAKYSMQHATRRSMDRPYTKKEMRVLLTDAAIKTGNKKAIDMLNEESTRRKVGKAKRDSDMMPVSVLDLDKYLSDNSIDINDPAMTYKEFKHRRDMLATAKTFTRDLPIIGYDGEVVDVHGGDGRLHENEVNQLVAAKSKLETEVFGETISWQRFKWLLIYDGGTTVNGGSGEFQITVQQVKTAVERMLRNYKRTGLLIASEQSSMSKLGDRYSMPLLDPDTQAWLMSFDSISKRFNDDPMEMRNAMVAEAMNMRGLIENIVANGSTSSRAYSAKLKKKALLKFLDWTFYENGMPTVTGYIYNGQYVTDMISDSNRFWSAVFGNRGLEEARKQMEDEYDRVANKLADLAAQNRTKTNEVDGTVNIKSSDTREIEKYLDYATRLSQMMAVLSPSVMLSNIVDKGIHTNMTFLALKIGRQAKLGTYTTGININQDAVRMFSDNPMAQKTFIAYRMSLIDDSTGDLINAVGSEADLDAWIQSKRNRGGAFLRVSDALFNAMNGGNIFLRKQMSNFINYFFLIEADAGHNFWFIKPDGEHMFCEQQMMDENSGRLLLDILTGKNPASFDNAQVAMNFAMQGDMAQRNVVSMLYQALCRRYPAAKFFTTTFVSKFFQYRTNQIGRTLQWILPVSSFNYWATNLLAEYGQSEFSPDWLRQLHVEDAQVFTSGKRALMNDMCHMAPVLVAMVLAAIPGVIFPPEDEDKWGNPEEWLFLGSRIYTDWELEDIMGMALPWAAFFKSCSLGNPRADILINGLSSQLYNNPIAKMNDIVAMFGDGEGSLLTSYESDVETFEDARGGSPSWGDWLIGKFEAGMLSYAGQFVTPAFMKEFFDDTYEHSYRRVYETDTTGALTEEGERGRTMLTDYRDAQIRKVTRNNPILGWIMNWANQDAATGYLETQMPLVEYYDPVQMENMRMLSINNEDGTPKSYDEQEATIAEIITILQQTDDMEMLADTGFFLDYDTRYAVGDTIWDICTELTRQYNEMLINGELDFYVLGNGDFNVGQARATEIKQAYYDELNYWKSIYYDKLESEPLRRNMVVYNRYKTSYAQDDNGEYYATGYYTHTGVFGSLLPIRMAPGSVDAAEGTMGYVGDFMTPSAAVPGASTGERALEPAREGYWDTIDFEAHAVSGDGTGYSQRWAGSDSDDDSDGGDGSPSYGYRSYGYGRRGRGGGGGGGGYTPNIYSRLPNVYMPSAKTMYAERTYSPNYDYLRPNFETKGSREAYKRSDI